MKRLRVIVPPVVQTQIRSQVLYIAKDSINHALAWEDRLLAAIKKIGEAPGHAIDKVASKYFGESIHKTVFEGTYLIHYRLNKNENTVEIVNFRHGMRRSIGDES